MVDSVQRIYNLDLDLVLPGHNDEISQGREIKLQCERHLEMATGSRRVLAKALSRARARAILELNYRVAPLPEWITNQMQS